jgi:hypothetical protein
MHEVYSGRQRRNHDSKVEGNQLMASAGELAYVVGDLGA